MLLSSSICDNVVSCCPRLCSHETWLIYSTLQRYYLSRLSLFVISSRFYSSFNIHLALSIYHRIRTSGVAVITYHEVHLLLVNPLYKKHTRWFRMDGKRQLSPINIRYINGAWLSVLKCAWKFTGFHTLLVGTRQRHAQQHPYQNR